MRCGVERGGKQPCGEALRARPSPAQPSQPSPPGPADHLHWARRGGRREQMDAWSLKTVLRGRKKWAKEGQDWKEQRLDYELCVRSQKATRRFKVELLNLLTATCETEEEKCF